VVKTEKSWPEMLAVVEEPEQKLFKAVLKFRSTER
jgi:hypothetical protein